MEQPKFIDLRPNATLINSKFEGYKLSLETISKINRELRCRPDVVRPSEEQYSFLHAQLFTLQNHLVQDPWFANSVYFIDADWAVQNIQYDEHNGSLEDSNAVFQLPTKDRKSGDYNTTMLFISEKYCLISDGVGELMLIDTGDRFLNNDWRCVWSGLALNDATNFLIQDARFEIINERRQVHCLLLHVEQQHECGFEAVLEWVLLELDPNDGITWNKMYKRQLKGKSRPTCFFLEPKCRALIICSDRSFKFMFDAEKPPNEQDSAHLNPSLEPEKKDASFTWSQNTEEVIVNLDIGKDANLGDFKVVSDSKRINVMRNGLSLLDAELYERIESGLTTWNLENEILQLTMLKVDENINWTSLVQGETISPCELPNSARRETMQMANMNNENEDCDFGGTDSDREYCLERIDVITHRPTHRVYLGDNPPLFTAALLPGHYPPALAIRSDVDVCMWQSQSLPSGEWSLVHKGTLNAFGYVQASKQQKKFMQCSPDMKYAVICEPNRYVFIYKNNYSSASGLKNRDSGRVHIGQQKLYTMEENSEIVGILVENEFTLLLTETNIICLQINA